MVAGHYAGLDFSRVNGTSAGADLWDFEVLPMYVPRSRYISRGIALLATAG